MTQPDAETVAWLVEQSMLHQAKELARQYTGKGSLWQRPYAKARPRDASALASVWFTAYPPAIITREGESVLRTLGDPKLWEALAAIGVQGIHIGPTKEAGGLRVDRRERTPTIDGNFDRIGFRLDPAFGTQDEFIAMTEAAHDHDAIVIDDIIPAHTGKGADWRLAELRYQDYTGLYHMVEIAEADWGLLPEVLDDHDSVNLSATTVDRLQEKGYIVGNTHRVIFKEPGVKETNWSATRVVTGVDGAARRWVYLHYFKAGQPALNWLDPTLAGPQMILGDALHSLDVLGARMLRLDANGFLGIEVQPGEPAWSEGHPLSVVGNQLIAGLVRKLGGFTFQELNLTVDDIADMSHGGADLSYDFITRPAYQHALVTGDTEFLRLMLRLMHEYKIDPASLIHALQNHDELTLELVHFWTLHQADRYTFQGREWTGAALRDQIRSVMYDRLTGENAPYNMKFVENGVACTTASIITATLGIRDLDNLTDADKRRIQRVHLLLAMYNACQPGVFALSGWDLVGALPLPWAQVEPRSPDRDTRWINRGAYDLVNVAPDVQTSPAGWPRAAALYGPLSEQLQQPDSFARQLQRLLKLRQDYHIYEGRQVAVPDVTSPGLLVMVHELPDDLGTQVAALNFGPTPIEESVPLTGVRSGQVVNMLAETVEGVVADDGQMTIRLDGYEGKSYLIRGAPPATV